MSPGLQNIMQMPAGAWTGGAGGTQTGNRGPLAVNSFSMNDLNKAMAGAQIEQNTTSTAGLNPGLSFGGGQSLPTMFNNPDVMKASPEYLYAKGGVQPQAGSPQSMKFGGGMNTQMAAPQQQQSSVQNLMTAGNIMPGMTQKPSQDDRLYKMGGSPASMEVGPGEQGNFDANGRLITPQTQMPNWSQYAQNENLWRQNNDNIFFDDAGNLVTDPRAYSSANPGKMLRVIHRQRGSGRYEGADNYIPGEVTGYQSYMQQPGKFGNADGSVARYNGVEYEQFDPNFKSTGKGTYSGLGGMKWWEGLAMLAGSALGANFLAGNLGGFGGLGPGTAASDAAIAQTGGLIPGSSLPPGFGSVPGGSGVQGAPGNNPSAYTPPGSSSAPPGSFDYTGPPNYGDYGPMPGDGGPLDLGPPNYSDYGPMPDPNDTPLDLGPPNYSDAGPMPPGGPSPNNPGGTPGGGVPGSGGGGIPGGGVPGGGRGNGGGLNLGNILGLLGAAYGGSQTKQASDDMLAWLNEQQKKVDSVYAPGSPEYDYLWKQMSAKDAAAGRNSQYGPRSVELGAKLADIKAGHTVDLTKGIGHLMASSLNQGANAYAGIPAILANMGGGGGGFFDNIGIDDLTGWLDDLFGGD